MKLFTNWRTGKVDAFVYNGTLFMVLVFVLAGIMSLIAPSVYQLFKTTYKRTELVDGLAYGPLVQ